MKQFKGIWFSLVFIGCVSCQDTIDKSLAPKATKFVSNKPLIKKEVTEKEKLSEYGFFKLPLANLDPTEQVVLYNLNSPLFSNYAFKKRFIYLPGDAKMRYKNSGIMEFENGSILIKNFYYPEDFRNPEQEKKILETRLLIKENNQWKPLNYIWNEEQTEASLNYIGKVKLVNWINKEGEKQTVSYSIPNLNQCKNCHARGKDVVPIGPTAAQWNKTYAMSLSNKNQLDYFHEQGILKELVEPNLRPKLPGWDNVLLPIANRAKAYLDSNCAHCHNAEGSAKNSGLYLSYNQNDSRKRGIFKPPIAAGKGSGDFIYDIVPGHPDQSILIYRMKSNDPSIRMPEIGRSIEHSEAVVLLEQYIEALAQNN
jgi:uncharacterized repeat protein (TIGR03806 family)